MNRIIAVLTAIFILSCKPHVGNSINVLNSSIKNESFNDKNYVLNSKYPVGDVRRYGIYPDSSYASIHPFTNLPKITTVIDLAEQHGIELFFPKGNYGISLILDSRKNLDLRFNMAEFDIIHITNYPDPTIFPEKIRLKGSIVTYDRLGITEAKDIEIDSVYIVSNPEKNHRKLRSRGCHIYHGCKNIKINYLAVDDFGSGGEEYANNHPALAIDGWGNNPVAVQIEKVYIKSSDRHGIYITGRDHVINEVIIDRFGAGSWQDMSPMQDAESGEEKDFKDIWINRCYNSKINHILINEEGSSGKFTAHFDEGDPSKPCTIKRLKVLNDNPHIEILKNISTGVVVGSYE